jgi:acyl dehydratase
MSAGTGEERITVTDGDATDEELLKSIIGQRTSTSRVVVERGPVAFFADAVLDDSKIYRSPLAAADAGLPGIPAPPTFPLVMEAWGKFAEIQPDDAPSGTSVTRALGQLMGGGGLILHGEQEFTYHRPVVVGDVLVGEGTVVDAYRKESKGRTMTFVITETKWVDRETGEPVVTSRFNVLHRS